MAKKEDQKGVLVARIGLTPVGFVAVDTNWHTPHGQRVAEIHEFEVDPAFQGPVYARNQYSF